MNQSDLTLQSFSRRMHAMMFRRTALRWMGVWLMVLGVLALVVRLTATLPPYWWAYALASLAILLGAAWRRELKRRPSAEQLRATFDRENKAGGLVMADAEVDTEAWADRQNNLRLPNLRWRGGRAYGGLMLALIFLTVTLLVPTRFAKLLAEPPLEIGQTIEQAREQVDVLEEQNILSEQEAEVKRSELERLKEDASGFNPSKTWEALDHLKLSNQNLAEQAAQEALKKMAALTEAELLGNAVDKMPADAAPDSEEKALKELGALLNDLLDNEALENLAPEIQKALQQAGQKNLPMDPEQLAPLLKALRENKDALQKLAQKLAEQNLIPPNLADQLNQAGELPGGQALKDLLAKGGFQQEELREFLERMGQGQGGIDRGPGAGPTQYGQPTDEAGAAFKEEKLSPSVSLNQARLAGVTSSAPDVTGGEAVLGRDALQNTQAGGGSALTAPVLPRHRGTVNRFFQRGEE